jgi:PAS domain S-box-containing protein
LIPLAAVFLLTAAAVAVAMGSAYQEKRREQLEARARLAMAGLEALGRLGLPESGLQDAVMLLGSEPEIDLIVVAKGDPLRVVASSKAEWRGLLMSELPRETVALDLMEAAETGVRAVRFHEEERAFDLTGPLADDAFAMIHMDASGSADAAFATALRFGAVSLGALIVFGLFTATLLRRRVVARLQGLTSVIAGHASKVAVMEASRGWTDEITMLAEAVEAAKHRAEAAMQQLERLALVARRTTNAVIITDAERRITWVNEGFTRITGYGFDEVRGRVPGAFLQGPRTDPDAIATMHTALRRGEGCRVEVLNVARDGSEHWLDVEIQPLHDEAGALTGFMAVESDITSAVESRRRLEASERRQKLIVAGAELGTWDWHIPSGEVHFNERWCRMLGYDPSELEAHVRSWERIVHPEDAQMATDALQEHFEGRSELYRCEHRLRAKDGSIVWVLDSGKVYERDAEGRAIRMAGIHLDITERRRAEERFELAVKGSSAGIWDWDIRTNKNFMSARFKEMLGFPPDHPMDSYDGWADLLHPEDRERVLDALWAHVRTGSPYSLDYRLKHRSGEWRWYHAHGQAEWDSDGNAVRMAGSLEDIHENRIAETARARLAAIVEDSEDAILGLTLDGRIASANAAAGRMFDAEPAALLGRCELDLVRPEERERERAAIGRIARGERVEAYESWRLRGGSVPFEVSVALSPVRDEAGNIVGASKTERDISLRREKQELERLNGVLAQQNRRLEEMTERAHRFVDDVSHEFRTPLTVIKEYTGIIADGLGGPVSDTQQEWLQVVDVAAADLNQMVEDFLDSSKLRSGRLRVDRRGVTAESILASVKRLIVRKAAARQVNVAQYVEPGLPLVFADEEKVCRIVMNLMTNAIKFSPEGGTVVLSARALASGDVEFSVADHGPGLAPADLKLLFERFRQLPNALSPSVKGFGLGLNIARQLVWLNLGTISAQSEPGRGAIFSFTLPMMRMDIVIDRFFERLSEREEPPVAVAMLRISSAEGSAEDLRRLVVTATRPSDIAVESGDGRSVVVFGPTSSAETWRQRLVESLSWGGGTSPEVCIVGEWEYPGGCARARAAIRSAILMEQGHVLQGSRD